MHSSRMRTDPALTVFPVPGGGGFFHFLKEMGDPLDTPTPLSPSHWPHHRPLDTPRGQNEWHTPVKTVPSPHTAYAVGSKYCPSAEYCVTGWLIVMRKGTREKWDVCSSCRIKLEGLPKRHANDAIDKTTTCHCRCDYTCSELLNTFESVQLHHLRIKRKWNKVKT